MVHAMLSGWKEILQLIVSVKPVKLTYSNRLAHVASPQAMNTIDEIWTTKFDWSAESQPAADFTHSPQHVSGRRESSGLDYDVAL